MKRKKEFRLKCFNALNYIMSATFGVSVCYLNSGSCIPAIICAVSLAYLSCALYMAEVAAQKGLAIKKKICGALFTIGLFVIFGIIGGVDCGRPLTNLFWCLPIMFAMWVFALFGRIFEEV